MNKNKKKHQLLKLLSKQYIIGWNSGEPSGLIEDDIEHVLKIDNFQLKIIIADLCENDETKYYKPDGVHGWMATEKGVVSFNTKKYERIQNKIIWKSIKNWVQTVIPVLSLIITIMVILRNDKATDKKLQELKGQIEYIKQQELKIQYPAKTFTNQNIETDSLINK
jgi:hypothetical protein